MPLPDEGIKIAALPAASSPDAIDLVGVQAGVTKKLASTLLATQAELDAVNAAAAHLAGAETFTGAKTFSGATAIDLFTGATTKSLNFRPELGDNGANLGIQSKDWSGDSSFDGLQINGSDGIGFGFSGGVRKVFFDTDGQIAAVGQGHKFGLGAIGGAAGTYLQIDGDATQTYVRAFGTPVNVGIHIQPKGGGIVNIASGDIAIDAGTLRLFAVHVRTTVANAGTSGAPPAQVDGYITVRLDGVSKKIPYYAT